MMTLSEKVQSELDKRDIHSLRKAAKAIGVAHSTVHQILKHKKTGLKDEVKKLLIKFSPEIKPEDFTKKAKSGVGLNKRVDKVVDIKALLKKYDNKELNFVKELREKFRD